MDPAQELRLLQKWLGPYNLQHYAKGLLEIGADMEQLPHIGDLELESIEKDVFPHNRQDFYAFRDRALYDYLKKYNMNNNNNNNNSNNSSSSNNKIDNISNNNPIKEDEINLTKLRQIHGRTIATTSGLAICVLGNVFKPNESFSSIFWDNFVNGYLYFNNIQEQQQLKRIQTFLEKNIGVFKLIKLLSIDNTLERKLS